MSFPSHRPFAPLAMLLAAALPLSAQETASPPPGAGPAPATAPSPDAPQWTFRNHVLPVLSKAGCNTGGCHGALAGKGGFRLSLDAYDPAADWYQITRGTRGRRVDFAQPAASLLLTKPTAATRHKGGKRLDPRSDDYRVLAEWIAAGAPGPTAEDATLDRLEILPERSELTKGAKLQLQVKAHYSDGKAEYVTRWAKFASADETVAKVDAKTGQVEIIGHGEGAVTAWFSSRIVMARVLSPYPAEIPAGDFEKLPRSHFVDDLVLAQLQQLRVRPSPAATDGEWVRRAYLDTIGVLPTPAETEAFLADQGGDKYQRLADHLLSREEFVDYWTYRWADIFLISGRQLRPEAVKAYYDWLRENVRKNTPWDELVTQVLTAKGGSLTEGATNFYAVHQDPETMAENVSQAFLSLSINCAKCHNHPLEKWTNDQYYAFANLFARVRAKGWGGDARNGDGQRTLYVEPAGDLLQPGKGRAQPPAPLDAPALAMDDPQDRRVVLAEWLTSPENPYFTRAIVNRVWAAYFGIGLVNPVDDLRVSNPASNEPLFAALADHLVAHDYDLKSLMRLILTSQTYRRSSQALPENQKETKYFSRHYPRRIMAEVLQDAITDVTGVPALYDKIALQDGSTEKTEFYPQGTRAVELYDSAVASYFLKTFGRNERAITCECERSSQPSMVQVLHLANGDAVNDRLSQKTGIVTELLESKAPPAELVRRAFLACLSRAPAEAELAGFTDLLSSAPESEKRAAVEDLFWALMTSREFLFQH